MVEQPLYYRIGYSNDRPSSVDVWKKFSDAVDAAVEVMWVVGAPMSVYAVTGDGRTLEHAV